LGRARPEPERLTREVLSIRHAPVQLTPNAKTIRAPCTTDPRIEQLTSLSAGQPMCGAPRRNRTGDPILTMEPPGTAVRNAVSPGHARPSGPKLSVLFRRSYALSFSRGFAVRPALERGLGVGGVDLEAEHRLDPGPGVGDRPVLGRRQLTGRGAADAHAGGTVRRRAARTPVPPPRSPLPVGTRPGAAPDRCSPASEPRWRVVGSVLGRRLAGRVCWRRRDLRAGMVGLLYP
jgi:hypothetical protein